MMTDDKQKKDDRFITLRHISRASYKTTAIITFHKIKCIKTAYIGRIIALA